MASYQGELAALLTACCWSANSIFFGQAGKRVGSATVNHVRLWVALACLLLAHLLFFGSPFPVGVDTTRCLWFMLSGFIGFVIGDSFLFEAFVLIGPRLSMLLMTLAPIFSAALAWIFLGERLGAAKTGAIAVTIGGIGWVVFTGADTLQAGRDKVWPGVLLGIGGAAGQAGGYLFSKLGMADGFPALSGNLIRVVTAAAILGAVKSWRRELGSDLAKMRDRRALGQIVLGALLGPVLGVVLSLYAVARAPMGVAATLMSLSPVLMLPASHFLLGEKIGWKAIAGTLVAVAGAALLFLLP